VIDVAAPAAGQNNKACSAASNTAYSNVFATSGATPHATGIAALMLCLYNPNDANSTQLVQEDIEYILQASAHDVDVPPAGAGYDQYTGHGLVDAGAAIAMIQGPNCKVYHFGTDNSPFTKTHQLVEQNVSLELTEPYTTEGGQTFDKGAYTADVYKVSASVNHQMQANAFVHHYWERHSSSTVFNLYETVGGQNLLQPVERVKITGSPTSINANLEGYVYYLKNSDCSIEGWIPASPDDAELTYSLIGCLTNSTIERGIELLEVFPNPAEGQLTVTLPEKIGIGPCELTILDYLGRQVATWGFPQTETPINLDIHHLPQGTYTCLLCNEDKTYIAKIVKI
jgi:hypothetical protein